MLLVTTIRGGKLTVTEDMLEKAQFETEINRVIKRSSLPAVTTLSQHTSNIVVEG